MVGSLHDTKIGITAPLILRSGPLNSQIGETKVNQCMLVVDVTLSFFLIDYLEVAEAQTSSFYEVPNRRAGGFVG